MVKNKDILMVQYCVGSCQCANHPIINDYAVSSLVENFANYFKKVSKKRYKNRTKKYEYSVEYVKLYASIFQETDNIANIVLKSDLNNYPKIIPILLISDYDKMQRLLSDNWTECFDWNGIYNVYMNEHVHIPFGTKQFAIFEINVHLTDNELLAVGTTFYKNELLITSVIISSISIWNKIKLSIVTNKYKNFMIFGLAKIDSTIGEGYDEKIIQSIMYTRYISFLSKLYNAFNQKKSTI